MDLLVRLSILIGFFIFLALAGIGTNVFIRRRNLAKYDNYDRDLSRQDSAYLEQARADLEKAADVKSPFWYKIILYTGLLPMMVLCWAVLGGMMLGLHLLIDASGASSDSVIFKTGGELLGAFFPVLFGGICLAGFILYALTLRTQSFSNFVALNSSLSGNGKENVLPGLFAKTEHEIRSRQQTSSTKFSTDDFLNRVNVSYRNVMLKFFYGCMGFAIILAFFDLRSGVTFYETEMVGTGKYFTISPEQTIPYERITKVELYCYFYKGDAKARYEIFVDDNEFTSLELNPKTRGSLEAVNAAIRRHNQKSLEAGGNGTRRIPLELICMNRP